MKSYEIIFEEEKHEYRVEGIVIPSVTQVLSSVARKVDGKMIPVCDSTWCICKVSADFGISFHLVAKYSFQNISVDYPKEMSPWVDQLYRFKEDFKHLKPLEDSDGKKLIEYPMYHSILQYCGTPDLIAGDEKTIYVIDWKTSTAELPYWKYQTAAYAELFKHNFKYLIQGRKIVTMAVKFSADTFKPHTEKNWQKNYNYFLSCLNVMKG